MLFRNMDEGDLGEGRRRERFVDYIGKAAAYCVVEDGMVLGFVLCRMDRRTLVVDAMSFVSQGVCAFLLKGLYYCSEGVDSIVVAREANPGSLACHGFFECSDGTACKIMHESTWMEGTFYPHGGLVIEELLHGESRALGA